MQKINKGLIWALLLSLPLTAIGKISNVNDDVLPGDVDGDGKVTKVDATATMDIALGKSNTNGYNVFAADFNGDGKVTITDAVAIARYVAETFNGHDYVDLGLPSGILWATCNVGAENSEDYGNYYAWGEIETTENHSWSTYKYCNGSSTKMTKYCTSSSYGTKDGKTILESNDDVAQITWAGNWRMPTYDELLELKNKCTWKWTTLNDINGFQITGPNGNTIFLPAASRYTNTEIGAVGSYGYYWSSSLSSSASYYASALTFKSPSLTNAQSSPNPNVSGLNRYFGQSVRPVCQKN